MSQSLSARLGAIVLLIASIVGLIISLYAYFAALTGVNGTLGALVVAVVCVLLAVFALLLAVVTTPASRNTLRILILLALIGNCFAGALLHEWWLCLAMVIGLVGWLIDVFGPTRVNQSVYS